MLTNAILPITFGAFGMIAALLIYVNIIKSPAGEGRVKEISDEIHLGAMVFMASEYKRLAIFCLICIAALYASLGADTAISFTLGALCSGTAGYIGMYSATKANVRTAVAANTICTAFAKNDIVARAAKDAIVACRTTGAHVVRIAVKCVIARSALKRIAATATVDDVVLKARFNAIVSVARADCVLMPRRARTIARVHLVSVTVCVAGINDICTACTVDQY